LLKALRYWLYQLFLSAIAILAGLILLEAGFRLARHGTVTLDRLEWRDGGGEKTDRRLYEKNDEFEFTATINPDGFRGPALSLKKPEGVRRLLILGDSLVLGWGVNDDQMFTRILDREMNNGGKRVEIMTAAGGSLSPLVYYVMLKKRLLDYAPDVVVVFLNYADLREDYSFKENIIRDENNAIVDINPLYVDGRLDWWRWLRNRCEFCSFTYNKIARPLRQMQALGFWNYVSIKLEGRRVRDAIYESAGARSERPSIELDAYFMLRENADAEEVRQYWGETAGHLSSIQELLKERNIPMILALLPQGIQAGPTQWSKGRVLWGFEAGKIYDSPLMVELIQSYARDRGIAFVNLTPPFRQAADRPLFYDKDGHMRPSGHEVLARALLSSPAFVRTMGAPPH
jgi:hypothetical protein